MRRTGEIEALAAARGMTVKQLIIAAFEENGSVTGAARAMGVNCNTLRYWAMKNGIAFERVVRAA